MNSELFSQIFGDDEVKNFTSNQKLFLEEIFYIVSGSYDQEGIVMWFNRERCGLNQKSPKEFFLGDWDPESENSLKIRTLASRLFL